MGLLVECIGEACNISEQFKDTEYVVFSLY